MQSFDPIYLQRLVDGELDREEVRRMLELAESNPILWREMAGAFVESQLWDSGFQKLEQGLDPEHCKRVKKPNRLPASQRLNWLVMAAGIVITLTAGLLIGQRFNSNFSIADPGKTGLSDALDHGLVADGLTTERTPEPASDSPTHTLVDFQPDYRLELEDVNGNPVFETEIPLYNLVTAKQAGYQIDRRATLPPKLVERAARRGYWLDQHMSYVSGSLGDGRIFVIPVRTINLVRSQ